MALLSFMFDEEAAARGLTSMATQKRVRARVGGHIVADSRRARMVCYDEHPHTYAFPADDLSEHVELSAEREEDHSLFGVIHRADVRVGKRVVEDAATIFESGPAARAGLEGLVALNWYRMDGWYEESEEVFVHPRDPGKRIDVLASNRHVLVELDGVRLAETRRPVVLIENPGLLPVRYYMPPLDVDYSRLVASDTTSGCPYKGFADYLAFESDGGAPVDIAWRYKAPFAEVAAVRGLVAFFNERVDMTVDGEPQPRPKTPWS